MPNFALKVPEPIVVFVRPQAAGNIGALARVMSNFGILKLRIVGKNPALQGNPEDSFRTMDWALAKRGEPILNDVQWCKDLTEALTDTHLSIGTSGRDTEFELGYARPIVTPSAAFKTITTWAETASTESFKWALVFGPEDDGLCDHEAAQCTQLIRIPTHEMNPSMNIAMAAGVLFYHWQLINQETSPASENNLTNAFMIHKSKKSEAGRENLATEKQKETFLNYLMETLSKTSFLKYPDSDAVTARIRRWLQAGLIPLGELLFAFEIVYHFRAWGSGHFEPRDFLTKHNSDQNTK